MDPVAALAGWPSALLYKADSWSPTLNALIKITGHCGEHTKSQAKRDKTCITPDSSTSSVVQTLSRQFPLPSEKYRIKSHMGGLMASHGLVTVGHGPRPFNYVLGVYFGHARSRPVTVQHGHICDKKISQHATFFRHEKAHSMKSWGSINHDRISLLQSVCSSQFIQQLRQMAISKIAMVIVCLLAVVHDCCLIKTETKQMNHIWGPHCFHQSVKET